MHQVDPEGLPEVTIARPARCCVDSRRSTRTALILFLAAMPGTFGRAVQLDKINLLPVTLSSPESADVTLKERFYSALLTHLNKVPGFHVEVMTDTMKAQIEKRSMEDYNKRERMHYMVQGSLVALGGELQVSISVIENGQSVLNRQRRVPKDFAPLLSYFDRLADLAVSAITKKPVKEVVYTYCFGAPSLSDADPRRAALIKLPPDLQAALSRHARFRGSQRYEVEGIPLTHMYRCRQTGDLDSDLRRDGIYVYDYVITGVLGDEGITVVIIREDSPQQFPLEPAIPWDGQCVPSLAALIAKWTGWKE